MSEDLDIEISEFLDGELEEARFSVFIKRFRGSGPMKKKLSRYAVARDCMRRAGATEAGPGFADRVMADLEDEPVVLAPKRRFTWAGGNAASVLKPAAGLAVAATVATLAVLGLRDDGTSGPERAVQPRVQEQQLAGDAVNGRAGTPSLQYADAQVRTPVAQAASASDRAWFNDYLLRHNEATGFVGRSGFMPYVHIVTTERPNVGESGREVRLRRVPVNGQPE